MNKRAFNARARVGRSLARIANLAKNEWVRLQAIEYARSGSIGPDLSPLLAWYWGKTEEFPPTPYGSLVAWERQWTSKTHITPEGQHWILI